LSKNQKSLPKNSQKIALLFQRSPHGFLDRVSTRIVNEVERINRVVYDITSKPPATIEWE